jgi:carotenoid 1,2-hydratase
MMLGSVFSPRYARARRLSGQPADPLSFSAVNVVVYGPDRHRWAMSEYPKDAVERSAEALCISGSTLRWDGDALVAELRERTAPFPRLLPEPLVGRIRLTPTAAFDEAVALAPGHVWRPVAPVARAEVELEQPAVRFSGSAYHDFNAGARGLEDDFRRWDWCRASSAAGTTILYDATRRDGSGLTYGRRFAADGTVTDVEAPVRLSLGRTSWGVRRGCRSTGAGEVREQRRLEDSPFYARSWLTTDLEGLGAPTMHESLDLDRFRQGWVRFLLPFKMRGGRAPLPVTG